MSVNLTTNQYIKLVKVINIMDIKNMKYENDGYVIYFPKGFKENKPIYESKGYIVVDLFFKHENYEIIFYDKYRLLQDIESDLKNSSLFFEPNIVVVEKISFILVTKAIDEFFTTGDICKYLLKKPN